MSTVAELPDKQVKLLYVKTVLILLMVFPEMEK